MTDHDKESRHDISFADPETQLCPFAAYERLRSDSPAYRDPVTGNYILTRYSDVRKTSLNVRTFSNRTGFVSTRSNAKANAVYAEKGWMPMDTLVSNDPPEHRTYRTLVDKVFSQIRVAAMEPRISEIINELIDSFIDEKEIDFLDAFAIRLPMYVIAEQLGVPRSDMKLFKLWSDVSVEASSSILSDEREVEIAEITTDLQHYLSREIERVKLNPNDTLISHLANTETDGRTLDMRELLSIVHQILVAGNETTTTTLASGMKLLVDDLAVAERLYEQPGAIKAFVEETLRTQAPIQAMFRRVMEDVTMDGVVIPKGALVELRYGAANRDSAQYVNADEIDLMRPNAASHLSFGAGPHLCIGNQLARGELRLAFEALTRRLRDFRLSRGESSCEWMTSYITYGPRTLWIAFDPR